MHHVVIVVKLSKYCFSYIRELHCVRLYLDSKTASTVATSVIHFKLDCCNSLYYSLPKISVLNHLHLIQNYLARAVRPKAPKFCHISPVLKSLHVLDQNK